VTTYRIAVIGGTGPQGKGLGYRFARHGHTVVLGSRAAEKGKVAAEEVAARLALPGGEVVDHGSAPIAVAPGSFAVVSRIPVDVDPEAWLDLLRVRQPEHAERSWIVTLAGGE
jgi:predicted dinucleotide-binding enzyme